MIAGIFHQGSGLGNQLHRYVATRVLAADKGYDYGMLYPQFFKGYGFMDLETDSTAYRPWNVAEVVELERNKWQEKKVVVDGMDVRPYDPEINFVQDNTIIDGEFQDFRYFSHRLDEVRDWLRVEPLDLPDDLCVINFRGGEYKLFPDLYLTQAYWDLGIAEMRKLNPEMVFEVHTDDPEEAAKFFPHFPICHDIGLNWRSIRYAKHLLLSNSSFAILPALLNQEVKKIIAPRYWARRNTGVWMLPQNYYSQFTYL